MQSAYASLAVSSLGSATIAASKARWSSVIAIYRPDEVLFVHDRDPILL
jgi:hypothetical protein